MGWLSDEIDCVELWPDNANAYSVFDAMRTQWTYGFSGPVGLRYEAIPFVAESLGILPYEYPDLLHDVRVMEASALEAIHGDRS